MQKEIFIIGGGPVGLYTALRLAKNGFKCSVFEEHKVIGKPIQCSGIVTCDILKYVSLDKSFLVNKFKNVKLYSKRKMVTVPVTDILIDREKFDKFLEKKARKAGVKIYKNHKFLGKRDKYFVFAKKDKIIKMRGDILIGADGPLSDVSDFFLFKTKKEFLYGLQARVKGKFNKNSYEVYLGSIAPDFFSWIIPESENIARIGIASKKNPKKEFEKFLLVKKIDKKDIIDKQGGLIPIFNDKKISKKNVYLVGDSAEHVKASTGGGIVPGFFAAEKLVKSLSSRENYRKLTRKLRIELYLHKLIRRTLDNMSDKDYDKLIDIIKDKRVMRLLAKNNRDNALKLIFKIVLYRPDILRFLTKTF